MLTNTNASKVSSLSPSGTVHIFEAAGLGIGPFKLHHVSGEGGHCEYCGTPIVWRFYLKGVDNKIFFVGSDCVMKTGEAGLMKIVEAEVKKRTKELREAREEKKLDFVRASMKDAKVLEVLAKKPHPNSWYARNGKTLADYGSWVMRYGGKTSILNFGKVLAKAVEENPAV
jgi:hypothetical protein